MLLPFVAPIVAQLAPPAISERGVLAQRIDGLVASTKASTGGDLGVVIWDLETDVLFQRNSDRAFPLADLFRLGVALTAYEGIDDRKLSLGQTVPIGDGSQIFTVEQLLERMLVENDGPATDALYRIVGGADAINSALHTANIDGMIVRTDQAGLLDDARAGRTFANGGDNAGSPAAIALLLAELARGDILSDASRRGFLNLLLRVKTGDVGLAAGLPVQTQLAQETGTSARFDGVLDVTGDAGVAQINGRNVIIVAMLSHAKGTDAQLDAILAAVARIAWNATAGVMP